MNAKEMHAIAVDKIALEIAGELLDILDGKDIVISLRSALFTLQCICSTSNVPIEKFDEILSILREEYLVHLVALEKENGMD